MQRSTALGFCGMPVSRSQCLTQCTGAGRCDCVCAAGERHQCKAGRGALLAPLCLEWVARAMPGSEPVRVALPGLLGLLPFLHGLKDFASLHFIVLPRDGSAGLHSDAPALCSHRHCFLGPQILF